MTTFYAHHRVIDVDLDRDGDMLLFQWGTYGDNQQEFVFDITRQVITDDGDDDTILQLSLTLHYPTTSASPGFGTGSQWCSHPEQTEHFQSLIAQHPATSYVLAAHPHRTELTFDHAG
ncbi:hypothetical protein [Nocardia sp. NPDC056000]|uniref:hypothetical protein n=1 Tax=Nocardia sp. NPDC056000 TaxID=3345674 RepID=UPI0035D762D5